MSRAAPPHTQQPALRRGPTRIDRYLFMLTLRPMVIGLGIALLALLTERLVRLLDLMTAESAPLAPLLAMLAALLPHYLGLALPAAFALGLLVALSSLSASNELDVLEGAGWSIRRITASFVVAGILLAMLSVALFGFAQPHARYAYRDAKHTLLTAGWDGSLTGGQVIEFGDGDVVSAERVLAGGQRLERVFVLRSGADGEMVTTAARGLIAPDIEGGVVRLLLEDGVSLTPDGVLRFDELVVAYELDDGDADFRARGALREQTLTELAARLHDPPATAELHARLARAFSLISIALAMIPLGLLRKRAPVWPRIIVALVGLTIYHHALLLAQELGAAGHVSPGIAIWGTTLAVFALALWLYATTPSQGTPSLLRRLLRLLAGPALPRTRIEPVVSVGGPWPERDARRGTGQWQGH